LIRDRDGKFPGLFDAILADAGIKVVLSGVQMPRMNAVMVRWVQTCRRELLDRTLIWNQAHLLHALREFEQLTATYSATHPPALLSRCVTIAACGYRVRTRRSTLFVLASSCARCRPHHVMCALGQLAPRENLTQTSTSP
jgi:hypothetical protein